MIRILMIRHGETNLLGQTLYGRMPGVHLSSQGERSAQAMARALKERVVLNEIVSSPLERALQTARFLAEMQHLSITTDEGVNELEFGSWMGKGFEELGELNEWKEYNALRSLCSPPGGEFMLQVQLRAWRSLERILARYENAQEASVAVVTHGDVIRGLLLLLLGMPIDFIHRLEISPASVTEIQFREGHPKITFVNQTF
jgi:broad specificity phosphatase PhoE